MAVNFGNFLKISIHTFLAEGDAGMDYNTVFYQIFQSTPSSQKATKANESTDQIHKISIHTFLAEGDQMS